MTQQNRQLAAITFIDIVDFSKLMHEDEEKAIHLLSLQKDVVHPIITTHDGKILKEMGDGLLVSFNSAIQAVECSLEIQMKVESIVNLNYRIGIHIGDVVIQEGDVFGDGVNIASRIQHLAETGGICISRTVFEAIKNHPNLKCTPIGEKKIKGIAEKIDLYKMDPLKISKSLPDQEFQIPKTDTNKLQKLKTWITATVLLSLIFITIFGLYNSFADKYDNISIAILPFGNTIKDEDFDYLSQQFVDDITYKLTKINYLSIKDFSQVIKIYESIDPSKANIIDLSLVQKLGKKINANYILYGNYLIFNKEQIKITCNLSDVENGTIINVFQKKYNLIDLAEILDTFPGEIELFIQQSNLNKKKLANE